MDRQAFSKLKIKLQAVKKYYFNFYCEMEVYSLDLATSGIFVILMV